MKFFLLLLAVLLVSSGCKKKDVTVQLPLYILVADPYIPIMQLEVNQYTSLYSNLKIEVRGTSTREAIVGLLNDSVYSIVIDRPFNEEEIQVSQQISKKVVENRFAEDGVAFIVNKQNPISYLTAESAKQIVTKEITEWRNLANNHFTDKIELVLTGRNSGMYELLQTKFFPSAKQIEPAVAFNLQREVIQYVSANIYSVGCVASSLVIGKNVNVKVIPIRIKTENGEIKDCYPGQQELHQALYPFHYSLYLNNAESKEKNTLGFSALVLSHVGQKIIQQEGLVPVVLPYRTIQINAE